MNEYTREFERLNGRFLDCNGEPPVSYNTQWAPIVVTKEEIDAEVERLAASPLPSSGRRESLIAHPNAREFAPGMAPGIQVRLSVLKPGERTLPFRHNATEVNFCIRGQGVTDVGGKQVAFKQYDVWNHPSYTPYSHYNDGRDLQVRLTYSNVPLLQFLSLIHI